MENSDAQLAELAARKCVQVLGGQWSQADAGRIQCQRLR